jgi:two-component system, chemotaxis family, CheB/CheR fusion protein
MSEQDKGQIFEALLEHIRQTRGFDFTGYKRLSLQRRVIKQMRTHSIDNFSDYLDYLEVHPEEFLPLFNTVLINVTDFFRDLPAWEYLWKQLLPKLLAKIPADEPIRIWSAGCSSGEEAYTLAMILSELLEPSEFRQRVKIYATDVDEDALAQARRANYSLRDLQSVPEALRNKYFEPLAADRYVFRQDLRRSVIFGRHDLVQDAPISHLDLLVCRNTLMYFNAETQGRIVSRMHFALSPRGALFLGKAEMLLTHGTLFSPIHLPYRIFEKVPSNHRRDRVFAFEPSSLQNTGDQLAMQGLLKDAAFNAIALAHIVVDIKGELIMANHRACALFNVSRQDLGKPFHDLELSYRPLELRTRIQQVYAKKEALLIENVERPRSEGGPEFFNVQLMPLRGNGGNGGNDENLIGVSITFDEVTRYHQLQIEVHSYEQNLATANEELQSSNEELETTNEELQSTNEELETTNEELQSTNEELETMNEELQSTNEELQTMNDELQMRTKEAGQSTAYLTSVLASIDAGVVVLDRQFNILTWNKATSDLWGLRLDEVEGQSFWSLDIGLPVDDLRETIRSCLNGEDRIEFIHLASINRRGKTFDCRITCTPLMGPDHDRQGVILLMEETPQ